MSLKIVIGNQFKSATLLSATHSLLLPLLSSRVRVPEWLFLEDGETDVPGRGRLKFPGARVSEQTPPVDLEACVP